MIRLVVDGVAFQRGGAAAAPWRALLPALARQPGLTLLLLDRGGCPAIDGAQALPFPAHRGRDAAADAALLQQMCALHRADAFTTTGGSSPLATPMALLLPAGAPGFDSGDAEAETAVAFAQHYVCTDAATADALAALYPEVPAAHVTRADAAPEALAAALARACRQAAAEAAAGRYAAFFAEWQRLREVQAAVDCDTAGL